MTEQRRDAAQQAGTLRDFLTILFKHRTKMEAVFLGIVSMVIIGLALSTPTYEARSSVLIKLGREYLYQPEVGRDRTPVISLNQQNHEETINSEIQILTDRDLAEKVITAIGMEKLYPDLAEKKFPKGVTAKEVAIIEFGKKLKVEGVKRSNVIDVSFQHNDPRLAARAVDLLLDYFKEKHLQVYSDPKPSFLEEQLADYRRKLKTSEDALQTFKQARAVYSLDEQRKLILEQRMKLDTAYKETENAISGLQEKLRSLRAQSRAMMEDGNAFASSEQGNIITDAKSKMLELRLKEQDLLVRYKEDSLPVKDVRKQIRMTTNFLAAQEKDVTSKVRTGNLVYQAAEKERIQTEADLSAQKARLASLGPQAARVNAELRELDHQEKDFQGLKREAAINEANYQVYVQKYEEARISDDMNRKKMANVSIIQAAAVPIKPVKPKKLADIALSIVLGAAAAVGAALFSEYLGRTFNTAQDVERRLGLPVLASIAGSPHEGQEA